jgi:iron complex outermembrane receptor protein
MRTRTPFKLSTLSAAIASTLVSGYAGAQSLQLEEVIVTATRRAQSIQDIPINITALSGDMIQRQRLTDLSDIARVVPGLTVIDQGPRSGNTLTVRGLSAGSIQATDQDNNGGGLVATYVGDIPLYIDLKLNDLDRVEVLMGPQGTLYGAGTLGGAVRYIPNKPQADTLTYEFRGDVYDLSEASDAGYEGGGTVNIPIIEDKLALRGSVDYLNDPGFIDYNYLVRQAGVSYPQPIDGIPESFDRDANLKKKKDVNDEETWSGRLALRYTGEWLDSTLSYYYQDQELGGRQINHKDSYGTGKYESAHRFEEPNERTNKLIALELVADLGFAELTSATGYSEYAENGSRDQTDLILNLEFYYYENFPSFSAFTREDANEDTFSQELRLVSTTEGPWNWIVGGFYSKFKIDGLSQEFTPGFDQFAVDSFGGVQLRPDSLEYNEKLDGETTETAAFGELGYEITDAWQVTVGARWFKFEDDVHLQIAFPLYDTVFFGEPQNSIIPTSDDKNDTDDDDVIYKFNTSYDFSDDIMGFLTVSEGYRLGSVNALVSCPTPPPEDRQFACALPNEELVKSDKSTNYEIGVHSQFGDSILLNGSTYYIEWDDIRLPTTSEFGAIPIDTNGGKAKSYGIELSGQYYISPDFFLTGSYAYNKAELDEDAPGIVDGADGFDGDRLPGTPEHQGFLSANYSLGLNDGSNIDFNWSMTAQSNVYTKVGKRNFGEDLDGFTLHYVSATWNKDAWSVALYGENVFDKYAETGVRDDVGNIREVGLFDLRRYYHNVVRPRQVGLRFKYNFDG